MWLRALPQLCPLLGFHVPPKTASAAMLQALKFSFLLHPYVQSITVKYHWNHLLLSSLKPISSIKAALPSTPPSFIVIHTSAYSAGCRAITRLIESFFFFPLNDEASAIVCASLVSSICVLTEAESEGVSRERLVTPGPSSTFHHLAHGWSLIL